MTQISFYGFKHLLTSSDQDYSQNPNDYDEREDSIRNFLWGTQRYKRVRDAQREKEREANRVKKAKEAEELKKKVQESKANAKQKEEDEKKAKKEGKPIKEPPFMDFLMNFIGAAKIHINRLHIRYEDDYFNHNRPFAFGFTIE